MKSYITFFILMLVAGLGLVGPARADNLCDLSSLSGAYGYSASGFVANGQGTGTFSGAGRFVADGNGGLTIKDTVSQSGAITRTQKYSGRYTVNADCTGSISLNGYYDFVLVNNNTELHMVGTDQGSSITGTAKKQVIPFLPVLQ